MLRVKKGMAQRLRIVTSLLLALVLSGPSLATGVCAVLCNLGIRCPAQTTKSGAKDGTCCEKERNRAAKRDCCEWIGKVHAPDQTLDARVAIPMPDLPVIRAQTFCFPMSTARLKDARSVPHEIRGPPGPGQSQHHSRAPPICRV